MLNVGWNDGHTLTGVGTGAAGIIKETDRNRAIGRLARKYLVEKYEGVKITNCTIDSSSDDLQAAVNIANSSGCDVFISNHVNAGGGVGFEGFYSRMASSNDIAIGKIIYNELISTKSCLADRRFVSDYSYKGYDLYVLRNTAMTAFLFEIGFVDNQRDVNAVNNEEVAMAYADGIAKAYGLKRKEVIDMDNVVLYFGDADAHAAIIVSQKFGCPLMRKSDYENSGLTAKNIIKIGGNDGESNRFDAFKNAAKLV